MEEDIDEEYSTRSSLQSSRKSETEFYNKSNLALLLKKSCKNGSERALSFPNDWQG